MTPARMMVARADDAFSFLVPLLVVLLLVVPLAVASVARHLKRASAMLDRWAAANGLRLVSKEYRWFAKGPFFWTSGKYQVVYRIVVGDAVGRTYGGWARCGGWFRGMATYRVDVRWDHHPPQDRPAFPVVMPGDRPQDLHGLNAVEAEGRGPLAGRRGPP